jgi:MFS family permease
MATPIIFAINLKPSYYIHMKATFIRRAPTTLLIFVVGWLLSAVAAAVIAGGDAPLGRYIVTLLFLGIFGILLLRKSKIVWILLVIGIAVGAVVSLAHGQWWWSLLSAALLGLLLAPSSRGYIWDEMSESEH